MSLQSTIVLESLSLYTYTHRTRGHASASHKTCKNWLWIFNELQKSAAALAALAAAAPMALYSNFGKVFIPGWCASPWSLRQGQTTHSGERAEVHINFLATLRIEPFLHCKKIRCLWTPFGVLSHMFKYNTLRVLTRVHGNTLSGVTPRSVWEHLKGVSYHPRRVLNNPYGELPQPSMLFQGVTGTPISVTTTINAFPGCYWGPLWVLLGPLISVTGTPYECYWDPLLVSLEQ